MTDFSVFQQSPENVALLHILSNMENNEMGGGVEGRLLFGFTMVGSTIRNMFKKSVASDPGKRPFQRFINEFDNIFSKIILEGKSHPPLPLNVIFKSSLSDFFNKK